MPICRAAALALTLTLPAGALALTLAPDSVWPGARIPVCFETFEPTHGQERAMIRRAVTESWARESAVEFDGWGPCAADNDDLRVIIRTGYPRTEARGRRLAGRRDGMTLPPLWSLAALSVNLKATVHEFGHALGFGHEYARDDLPDPARCAIRFGDGRRYREPDVPVTPYDPHSVMVGCADGATAAHSSGMPTLSAGDIYGLVETYGSAPANRLGGDGDGDRFGAAIALGDLDADGVLDLAVGAPGDAGGTGAVFLFRGDERRGFRPWRRLAPDEETAAWTAFGQPVAIIDVDDDGRSELVAGARSHRITYRFDADGTAPRRIASPDLPLPPVPPRSLRSDAAAALVRARAAVDRGMFGRLDKEAERAAVALRDDLDGDGHTDLVLGLPYAHARNGARAGNILVFRGTGADSGAAVPWYRFGQAY